VSVSRRQWDETMSAWFERYAHSRWTAAEPYWGMWGIPQSRLPVLPADLAGAAAVELGCGSAYVSAWLAQRGARPVGVDVSARQLAVARRMQDEIGPRFPLVQGDAERVPLADGSQRCRLVHVLGHVDGRVTICGSRPHRPRRLSTHFTANRRERERSDDCPHKRDDVGGWRCNGRAPACLPCQDRRGRVSNIAAAAARLQAGLQLRPGQVGVVPGVSR
jgi:SAM-dependent methyltransferase